MQARSGLEFDVCVPLPAFTLSVRAEVPPGITVLVGPSGSGKTTLLRCLAGLIRPKAGFIRLHGRWLFAAAAGVFIPPERRHVGYVPQQYGLFPHLRVADNVAYGLLAQRVPAAECRGRVQTILERMGIAHLADRLPRQLSGGEAQRVALARACVLEPDYVLLDEPLAALDPDTRQHIRQFMRQVLLEAQCPVLCVTHDLQDVQALADRVISLQEGTLVTVQETMARPHTPQSENKM
ncbi:MAG: ATP-binding cassette domain-containing protein [Alicyclobacillus sp.]|nr:ATP-binding cassette domain-containing protein [Alicyclobacillus sp.]